MNKKTIMSDATLFLSKESIFGPKADQQYMSLALKQAQKAGASDEVPVGAVIVDAHGVVIARGYNKVECSGSQTSHAELNAIVKATRVKKNWRLTGCWLYVTLEPCIMCIGLMVNSRLSGVVYGAQSPLFGYNLDKRVSSWVYKKNAFRVVHGVCIDQSVGLLKDFFIKKRERAHERQKKRSSID
jgi:tRNA(adenine34) deaminase